MLEITNYSTIKIRNSPVSDGIFDMVAGGVDEQTAFIPSAGFDSSALVQAAQNVQLLVADGKRVFG